MLDALNASDNFQAPITEFLHLASEPAIAPRAGRAYFFSIFHPFSFLQLFAVTCKPIACYLSATRQFVVAENANVGHSINPAITIASVSSHNTRTRAYAYMSDNHLACPARIATIALALPSGVRAPVDSPP